MKENDINKGRERKRILAEEKDSEREGERE